MDMVFPDVFTLYLYYYYYYYCCFSYYSLFFFCYCYPKPPFGHAKVNYRGVASALMCDAYLYKNVY